VQTQEITLWTEASSQAMEQEASLCASQAFGFTCLQSNQSFYIYAKGEVRIIMPVYI
jgi:hypothetical protein